DPRAGLGLRNMQERVEKLNGTLNVVSSRKGTVVEIKVPLSHMLAPERAAEPTPERADTLETKGAA
ncbi:MAG: hypothetical protein AAFR50_08775, partial [Pseudomonadota bacterium]